MKSQLLLLSSLLASSPVCYAWGNLGHETIAYVASNFVSSQTQTFCQNILSDTSADYLAKVATWADTYRYTHAGRYSAPFHFIDAHDSPPHSCGVDYSRDCGEGGCVVQAIQNYTSRVTDNTLSTEDTFEALKFIIHFVGDIHQPLHDENLDVGGNDIKVTFGKTQTNLHHIWDTNMPEKFIGGTTISYAEQWATTLVTQIKSGSYASQAASWLQGINVADPVTTTMGWATEANAYVCSTVMPDGVDPLDGAQLDGDYYDSAMPVIELQFARAGYRLAAWLNLIATGSSGLQSRALDGDMTPTRTSPLLQSI